MNTYYFNNSALCFENKIIVITENAFRKIQDNLLCGTPNGSWGDHWIHTEAKNLAEAKASLERNGWFKPTGWAK